MSKVAVGTGSLCRATVLDGVARLLHAPRTPPMMGTVMRLGLLACAGLVMQIGWAGVWTFSYRLTHGNEYTYAYLVDYPAIWEKLYDLLVLANRLIPGIETTDGPVSLDIIVNSLAMAFVIVSIGYLAGVLLIDRGIAAVPGALAVVLASEAIQQLSLFAMPGLFTTDLASYVMYGHISAMYDLNPYIYPPAYFPGNELLQWIHPIWHDQPSVYGPLWTDLGWLVARVTGSLSLLDQLLAYKVLMNLVQVINLALVWWLLGRLMRSSPRARLTAFTVFAWNPLMLFDTAGNAHNDALMVTLLLLGMVPLVGAKISNYHWLAGIVLIGLSAMIKFATGLVGLLYIVPWARQLGGWRARLAWIGGTGLLVAAITAGLFSPWYQPRALQPIVEAAAGGHSWQHNNSVPDIAAVLIDEQIVHGSRFDRAFEAIQPAYGNLYETPTTDATRGWMKLLTKAIFLLYLAWECRGLWRIAGGAAPSARGELMVSPSNHEPRAEPGSHVLLEAVLAASVRAFLVLLLLVLTWVLEWYFFWPLALGTLLGWRRMLTKVVVAYTLTSLPVFYVHHYWSWHMPAQVVLLYAVPPLLLPVIAAAWQRVRQVQVPTVVRAAGVAVGSSQVSGIE